jgi:hypothetical protein
MVREREDLGTDEEVTGYLRSFERIEDTKIGYEEFYQISSALRTLTGGRVILDEPATVSLSYIPITVIAQAERIERYNTK